MLYVQLGSYVAIDLAAWDGVKLPKEGEETLLSSGAKILRTSKGFGLASYSDTDLRPFRSLLSSHVGVASKKERKKLKKLLGVTLNSNLSVSQYAGRRQVRVYDPENIKAENGWVLHGTVEELLS